MKKNSQIALIKKYANRRLYNTVTSSYITLADICDLVRQEEEFVVVDAKTNEDITRSVLAQIILEKEASGSNPMLPTEFLRKLITQYETDLQKSFPAFLQMSVDYFQDHHKSFQEAITSALTGKTAMDFIEKAWVSNLDLLSQSSRIFPFQEDNAHHNVATPKKHDPAQKLETLHKEMTQIKEELAAMKKQENKVK